MLVFGQNGCIRTKVVVFGQNSLRSGKSGCIRAKVVVFRQSGCIREEWFYSVKAVVFGQMCCYWAKVVVFG